MSKIIKVGFDFDGVVAYNPFRVLRSIVVGVKRSLFGVKSVKFYYPRNKLERIFWIILHESSVFPSPGAELIRQLTGEGLIEAHLITGRYSFLDHKLNSWLKKRGLKGCFRSINLNNENKQPHLFKEEIISKLKVDYYIEDNWDIVNYLSRKKITEILWIYNLLDRNIKYGKKFPYLRKAVEHIIEKEKLQI